MPKVIPGVSIPAAPGQAAGPHVRFPDPSTSTIDPSRGARSKGAALLAPAAPDGRLRALLSWGVEFVIRRRVPISIMLFGGLIVKDLVTGVVPHDILDPTDPKSMLGLAAVLCGLAVRSWAAGFLVKDTELTTAGPYALVRNPLYLGSFLMIAGFCLLIDDPANMWICPATLLMLYWPKIRREEQGLAKRFPEAWSRYVSHTSRLVPRLNRVPQLHGWLIAQWMKSREYKAVLATTVALVALKLLRMRLS